MTKATALLLAARPKTLPAAVCPVVAGSALAWRLEHAFSWLLTVATLLSTIAIQVATNYFNDAVDSTKGADTAARLGPVRATASGLVSRGTMMLAGYIAALAAVGFSVPLIMERGWIIVLIGVVSLVLSYGYTGGPWPLAYHGLGEVFVMLFFGLVAVTGTVFVQTGYLVIVYFGHCLQAGLQVGCLCTALIAINNLRDIVEDSVSGKKTLAVRGGKRAARVMITFWCLLPYLIGTAWLDTSVVNIAFRDPVTSALIYDEGLRLGRLFWMPLPSVLIGVVIVIKIWRTEPSAAYNKLLALAGIHLLVWTILFATACVRG